MDKWLKVNTDTVCFHKSNNSEISAGVGKKFNVWQAWNPNHLNSCFWLLGSAPIGKQESNKRSVHVERSSRNQATHLPGQSTPCLVWKPNIPHTTSSLRQTKQDKSCLSVVTVRREIVLKMEKKMDSRARGTFKFHRPFLSIQLYLAKSASQKESIITDFGFDRFRLNVLVSNVS